MLADVRIDVKRAVGLDRYTQTQFFEFGQQIVQALLERLPPVFINVQYIGFKTGQGSVLGQAGRADRQVGGQLVECRYHVGGGNHPAQSPAGHVKIFRKAVDDDNVIIKGQCALRSVAVVQPKVDFIHDDEAITFAHFGDQCSQLVG